MKPKSASHYRRWVLRIFEWALLVSVVMLLVGVFLQRVERLQAEAERLSFEGVVNSLEAAVMLSSIIKSSTVPIAEGDNPMLLLDQVPSNYLGVLDAPSPDVHAGGWWYFDKTRRLLIYQTRNYSRVNSIFGDERYKRFYLGKTLTSKQLALKVVENRQ